MTGNSLARAASISDLMYSSANQLSSPREVRQRLIESRNGFGPLAAELPVDVDDEQCRPLSESGSSPEPACSEYGLVALGEELVPDPVGHRRHSLGRHNQRARVTATDPELAAHFDKLRRGSEGPVGVDADTRACPTHARLSARLKFRAISLIGPVQDP